ncbi:diguanylate cyclase (GGDEF) domain-containing protein [Alkaliphilus peptidifermentans DSM 18978]|uniref:Diguanylate cyclase (GGDEF) domain-containing protein n=2 Tax=Alkaliphilus TaxID=114627 RepID=A0A1G5F776_9FIRM|nr:diguanylate cyclase (GGDEF) domain-containing protein [Alkaliphilus peptidifermentans DSM 18978]
MLSILFSENFVLIEIIFVLTVLISMFFLINSVIQKKLHKRNRLYEGNRKLLESLIEISDCILKIENAEELFKLIIEKAVDIIDGAEKGSLMIINDDNKFEYKALVGFEKDIMDLKIDLEDSFLYRIGEGKINNCSYIIEDVEEFDKRVMDYNEYEKVRDSDFFNTKTAISAPIIIDDVLYGIINVDSTKKNAFKKDDKIIMEYFAKQAGTVIRNHQLVEKLVYLSQYDKLTNVLNRGYFEELFQNFFSKAERYNEKFALVIFDLDNLKTTNDTYGHEVGDQLIVNFARGMKEKIRQSDIFGRYGGDEFIAVFFETNYDNIEKKIDSILEEFRRNPITMNGNELFIEFSYGVAHYPDDSVAMNQLIRIADDRMYQHKQRVE